MIVVLAHTRDAPARALVARWQGMDARLLTAKDLSLPGWNHHVGGHGPETAVLGGVRVETSAIRGVVTRLPCIQEDDLPHIAAEDRVYAASEMTAFLKSWLSRLGCPVLNRPTASSLMGPNRSLERWMVLAARCGLAVASRPHAPGEVPPPPSVVTVTVVGERWLGHVDEELGARAMELAMLAGTELLTVRFDGPGAGAMFLSAEPTIDLTDAAATDAVIERIDTRRRA